MSLTNGRVHRAEPGDSEEGEPVDLAALLARRGLVPDGESRSYRTTRSGIADRLQRRFGLGDRPDLATKLFRAVEAWVEAGDESRYTLVSEIVAQAVSARSPGKYARATLARLIRPRRKEVDW